MSRKAEAVTAVLIALAGLTAINLYTRVTAMESEQVTDSVHVISGVGGNVGVLKTDRGAVIVDSMLFLIDTKVDPKARRQVAVLCDQLGPIWVIGHRLDERVKLTPLTRQVLHLKYSKASRIAWSD